MNRDFIQELGYLAVASRLKRLTDRLLRGGSEVYRTMRLDFEPRWFSLFYLLYSEDAPLSILEAAGVLKISHPAVIQTAQMLSRRGLVKSFQDDTDRRKRLLAITPKGKALAASLQPVWDCFVAATTELFQQSRVDILDALQRVEEKLDEEDIGLRILKKIKARQGEEVEVVDFRPEFKERFKTLNEEWLKKFFRVESADRRILVNPELEIMAKGGFVLFAKLRGEVVGTTAMLKVDDTTFELSKMAVTERAQGRQVGRRLTEEAIARARRQGAKSVILKTDHCLRAALSLYRKFGFKAGRPTAGASGSFEREKTATYMKLELG